MKNCLALIIICCLLTVCINGENENEEDIEIIKDGRITIKDNEFFVNGKRIWINGTNTPWNKWNEFGSNHNVNYYDDTWWDNHFAELREAGVNAVRVWINCNNGSGAIIIDTDGLITGVTDKHWSDLDLFFKTAERNQMYIMATLLSFDHFQNTGFRPAAERWRNMLKSDDASMSFVTNYTIPFVERYKDNPWLWSIDICNEPDWVYENENCGKIPWDRISYFMAINAAAIHENSKILVTVGLSSSKYNVDGSGYEGNKVSDSYLQSLYPNPNAYLDFWSPHYYTWVGEWFGVPFYVKPYGSRQGNSSTGYFGGWGLDNSKPAIIAEFSAKGTNNTDRQYIRAQERPEENNIISDFENAYLNGWQGVMPWTSNGVDSNGDLSDMKPATMYMLEKYGDIIFPHL